MAKTKKNTENTDKKIENYDDYDEPDMTKALQVRFPVALHEKIQKRAKKERRSFNSEVVYCLEKFFISETSIPMSAEDTRDFLTHLLYPKSLPK